MFTFSEKNEIEDKDLRTIGEVSEIIDVPDYVIRFWEKKFKEIDPIKRKNIRYYRQEDIMVLETIKDLLYKQGYTIKGVQKILKDEIKAKTEEQTEKTSKNTNVNPQNLKEALAHLSKAKHILNS
jgi:DNA-binding transcriptional MerR regulator